MPKQPGKGDSKSPPETAEQVLAMVRATCRSAAPLTAEWLRRSTLDFRKSEQPRGRVLLPAIDATCIESAGGQDRDVIVWARLPGNFQLKFTTREVYGPVPMDGSREGFFEAFRDMWMEARFYGLRLAAMLGEAAPGMGHAELFAYAESFLQDVAAEAVAAELERLSGEGVPAAAAKGGAG